METYSPENFETKWYEYWETNNLFSPNSSQAKETYTIVIPPPNVTGSLHIGHALVNTLQDVLIRWKRMSGYKTLWLPGTDHAGIATQMIVEKALLKKGKERKMLGREQFLEEVWKFKEESGGQIFRQLRRLGASCDWSRERFTLDEGLSKAVKKAFVDLYHEGLIYRGSYLVNWCPRCLTAISDLEVTHKDREGEITTIAYPLEDGSGEIQVATTRPETLLGDTAVAVNPQDERYKHLHGKKVRVPLIDRLIPIVADDYCDMAFGSGAVKVTPAHDPNDFLIGQRHNLESINIFTEDAKLNDVFPELQGEDRFEARKKVKEMLKERGYWKNGETHNHSVGECQRCATIVEPRLSTQWFCKMKDIANASLKAVDEGKITLIPKNQERILHEWLDNIQDWCLSRQLWWGHRIPAWYCDDCGATIVAQETPEKCEKCDSSKLTPEEDVLDTWFSSGLFPFSTMGWPDETKDLQLFYPNSTLITGYDILFFWVARMIMMGIKLTGQAPFPEVFLHGLVRDENGEKMSKTKGNVIDPLEIVEKFGADALRFTLTQSVVMGRDVKLSQSVIAGNRNFINKLWNATRFTLDHIKRLGHPDSIANVEPGLFDNWILSRLEQTALEFNEYLTGYRFNEAAKTAYAFAWHEFCDWYIEISKPALFEKLGKKAQSATLATVYHVLENVLKLLHPIMPFVTEELWSHLPKSDGSIMIASFPQGDKHKITATKEADQLIELVNVVRNIRGENNIKPNIKIEVIIATKDNALRKAINEYEPVVIALSGLKKVTLLESVEKNENFAGGVGHGFEVFVNLSELIDYTQEKKRLSKEKEKIQSKIEQIAKKLANKDFLGKAPEKVIQKNKDEQTSLQENLNKIEENLAVINANN